MAESERRLLVKYQAANGAGSPTSAIARDAALGGLFIETTTPLTVGALLSVELSAGLADLTATLEARVFSVRSTAEGPTKPAGMAVRFLDLPQGMLERIQAILAQHRPPARTRLGVGDENEALWSSAGGRDEQAPDDEVLAIAAAVDVEGRPTPATDDGEPPPERYPTPKMTPIAAPPFSSSHTPAWRSPSGTMPHLNVAPWTGPPPAVAPKARRPASKAWLLAILVGIVVVGMAVLALVFVKRVR